MKYYEFCDWLKSNGNMGVRPISDCLSRNKRIETQLKIDLNLEYRNDSGQKLMKLLTYTKEDKQNCIPSPVPIDGDFFNGLASLKSAVKKYFEFCAATTVRRPL
jgi:hypothetical protein